uniref:Uncharacterized protein n=1 Tax=Cacopsylla melanoneura TaxID=428564 RepID=A0A8D8TYE1_9HEMI
MYRNYSVGPKWLPGVVSKILSPLIYLIESSNGTIVKRHSNQVISYIPTHCLPGVGLTLSPVPLSPEVLRESPPVVHHDHVVTPADSPITPLSSSLPSPCLNTRPKRVIQPRKILDL